MSNVNKPEIIILHGWGLNGSKYKSLVSLLRGDKYTVFSPDLPGFGLEPLSKNFTLDDYVEFLNNFIIKNKISNPVLIGHSFGGRVAIKYSWRYPKKIAKLILTGVPVIRNRSIPKRIWFLIAVFGGLAFKIFPKSISNKIRKLLYFLIGEWDYYNAGPLRQVFKNIINEDLTEYLKEVKIPILLIWGKDDKITPAKDISKIKEINNSARSIIVEGAGHKLPYEKPQDFLNGMKKLI